MLSLLILIPLASVLAHSLQLDVNDYAKLITNSGIRNAFITSISCSVLAALVNCVFDILAWVLVRYDFFGKRLLNGVIELPFALPTAVAGITFPSSIPIRASSAVFFASYGIQIAYTKIGLTIAMVFVGIPVRRPLDSAGSWKLDRRMKKRAACSARRSSPFSGASSSRNCGRPC